MSDIKITKERIDALLGEADIRTLTLFGKCTVVTAKLKNGFVLTADSACVDPANYDKRTGERICLEHIANKLWELEGYRLQGEVFNKANRKGTAPGLDDEALDEMRTLCNRALRAWGAEMQSVVAAEELSELQKELCKSVRGEDNADAIAEEIADVQIMLEQMLLLHDCRDAVDGRRGRVAQAETGTSGAAAAEDRRPEPIQSRMGSGTDGRQHAVLLLRKMRGAPQAGCAAEGGCGVGVTVWRL